MSEISYFQRYSQKENHTTNNTLLILKHFYQSSPLKIQTIFTELLGEEMEIGLLFQQQKKQSNSIPDARISQSAFDIFIETKMGDSLDLNQMNRHIESIKNSKCVNSFLIGLTKLPVEKEAVSSIRDRCNKEGIKFVALTFLDLVNALKEVCQDYEVVLQDILNDYEGYLRSENLLPDGDRIVVVPCGTSMETNCKYKIYFEPSKRPSKFNSRFIGLYHKKRVSFVGEIHTVFVGKYNPIRGRVENSKLEKFENKLEIDEAQKTALEVFQSGVYPPETFQAEEHRFYFVEDFKSTDFVKSSKYGIRGTRIFNLHELLKRDPVDTLTVGQVAEGLKGITFT